MKYCTNCGAEVEGAKFCPKCGLCLDDCGAEQRTRKKGFIKNLRDVLKENTNTIRDNINKINEKVTNYPYEKLGTTLNDKIMQNMDERSWSNGAELDGIDEDDTQNTSGMCHVKHKYNRLGKKIIKKYYLDYPEQPYISEDRDNDWIDIAEMFPTQSIIPKQMMTRFADDDLLPGHVYMLHWLNKYTDKDIPQYFEYKYGIDFEEEIDCLREAGFLGENNKPTKKGIAAMELHSEVIKSHNPKRDNSLESVARQILEQRNQLEDMGIEEYEFIANSGCCSKCKKLDGKHFELSELKIGVNAPPMHEGCRCAISGYEDEEEYEKWLNSF